MLLPGILSGLLMGLSLFDGLEWICFFAFVPLFWAWVSSPVVKYVRVYFYSGYLAFFSYSLFVFYWIRYAGESYFLLGPFSAILFYLGFCALFALPWGLAGLIFGWLRKLNGDRVWLCLFLPFCFVLFDDLIYQFIELHFGFHWFALNFPGLSWARFVGVSNLGFSVVLINFLFLLLLKRKYVKTAMLGFATFGILLWLSPNSKVDTLNRQPFSILGIQGHISNEAKRNDLQVSEDQMMAIDTYYSLTRRGLARHPNVDLIIWPETAMPVRWNEKNRFQVDIEEFAKRVSRPILTGGYFMDDGQYNSTLLISKDGTTLQHSEKSILFPIGETIPFNDFGGLTANYFPEVPRFRQNRSPQIFDLGQGIRALTPICYEVLFNRYYVQNLKDANLIINLTNDGWFNSALQKKWHAIMALSRSVEYGLPVYRLTNNGLSAYATPDGKTVFYDMNHEVIQTEIFIPQSPAETFFKKNGELVLRIPRLLSYLLLFLNLLIAFRYRRHERLLVS